MSHLFLPFKKINPLAGFTLIETMVGMVVLAIGLLGMAAMTIWVVRSNRGADDLLIATNLCQMKVQELKDIAWDDLGNYSIGSTFLPEEIGKINGAMVREGSFLPNMGLDKEGYTRAQEYEIESNLATGTPGNDCLSFPDTPGTKCATYLDSLGPYKFIRSFVICKGSDYTGTIGNAQAPTSPINTTYVAPNISTASRPKTEPACRIDPTNNLTRYENLACKNGDISTAPGSGNLEKKIRITCAWKTREGDCHAVNMDTLVVKF